MNGGAWGLANDGLTWVLAAALVTGWGVAVRLCPSWRRHGWRAVPTSLLGFVWLGFGLTFIVRFGLLSIDSVLFGNMTDRLAVRPVAAVNETLLLAGGFWLCFCAGVLATRRRLSAGPLAGLAFLAEPGAAGINAALAIAATVCLLASSGPFALPVALVTPLAVVGRLWVIPATIVWWRDLRRGADLLRSVGWVYLIPGLLQAALSPYRQHLVTVAMVPLIAALFGGRRVRPATAVLGGAAFMLVATSAVGAARMVMWEGYSSDEAREQLDWRVWVDDPSTAPWVQLLRRFHGFDSLLLTVDLVPAAIPHSGREVFLSPLVRGVIPRALYPEKEASDRGLVFATSIWSEAEHIDTPAAIAPSMAGDLYEAGGVGYTLLGGLLWGALVGLCDGWRRRLPAAVAAGVTVLFGVPFAASMETDFAHTVATVIQTLFVVALVGLLRFADRRARQPATWRQPAAPPPREWPVR